MTKIIKRKIDVNAVTMLIGYLTMTYKNIVRLFGKPMINNGDGKVNWIWSFQLNNYSFTIYNWKDGYDKNGNLVDPNTIKEWHIGGILESSLPLFKNYLIQRKVYKLQVQSYTDVVNNILKTLGTIKQ